METEKHSENFESEISPEEYQARLLKAIPGGAHTYSRGYDQHPSNAPPILAGGRGAYVFDQGGKSFLDYGMSLRAVGIGYAEERINKAAIRQIELGNNLTRPSMIELEAAELLIDLIPSVDMVKFAKNGSSATTAAVKLARAYTGRNLILRCAQHPFFSYDDWFIGSTAIPKGIPPSIIGETKMFTYNDLKSVESLIEEFPNQFACLILEPVTSEEPRDGFLEKLQALCRKHGVIFILDEMITGFRWHLQGAQTYFGLDPDLCTFGKTMANGFSLAAIGGKREIMKLGSIEFEGEERVFLLSSTHGAEMAPLGAFVETVKFMKEKKVIDHYWSYGKALMDLFKEKAKAHGLSEHFFTSGYPCSPSYSVLNQNKENCLGMRTLFLQEMTKHGVMIPWIALCYRHGELELEKTARALDQSFPVLKKALEDGYGAYLQGPVIKPVFRRFN